MNSHLKDDIDVLNELRAEQSRSESMLPYREFNTKVGSYAGVRLNNYLNNLHRFELSKKLDLPLDHFERTLLEKKVTKIAKFAYSRRFNFGFKALLGLFFLNNLVNMRYRNERYTLERSNSTACACTTGVSFAAFTSSLIFL